MLINKLLFQSLFSICLFSAMQHTMAQTVLFPSNLYPGISWEIQPNTEVQLIYRQDAALQPKANLFQQKVQPSYKPRYRPLDSKQATHSIHKRYQYRSDIPDDVLTNAPISEYKQGLDNYQNNRPTYEIDYPSTPTTHGLRYRSEQQEDEYKQGLPDYQPQPLPSYSATSYTTPNMPPIPTYSQSMYPQQRDYAVVQNPYIAQPYNPWSPQQQPAYSQSDNPWQVSQSMYQNMLQSMPAVPQNNWTMPELPFDGQFYFQQNTPYAHDNPQQQRELPFSPEQVFIVPSHWIQAPTASQQQPYNPPEKNTQFTVYPAEIQPESFDLQEVW